MKKMRIFLVLYSRDRKTYFTKYFDTEFEKDKFKRKVKHIDNLIVIEDSTDTVFTD